MAKSTKRDDEKFQRPWKLWDTRFHYLFNRDPQPFLDMLVGKGKLRLVAMMPEKIEGDHLIVDGLVKTEIIENLAPLLVHVESEAWYNARMSERLSEHNQRIRKKYRYEQDVPSGAFHLMNDDPLKESPLIQETKLAGWKEITKFDHPIVEFQNLTPADLRSYKSVVVSSLTPLTQGGLERTILMNTFRNLMEQQENELVDIALAFTMKLLPPFRQEQFKEDFKMLTAELLAYPTARELGFNVQQDLQQGLQALRQGFLKRVMKYFPALLQLAQNVIFPINDIRVFAELSALQTQEEVEKTLLSLGQRRSKAVSLNNNPESLAIDKTVLSTVSNDQAPDSPIPLDSQADSTHIVHDETHEGGSHE